MKNIKIKMLDLNVAGVVRRFYLMMAGTIILGFLGQWFIAIIWAYTLSASFILGISFKNGKAASLESEAEIEEIQEEVKIIPRKKKRALQEVE